MMTIKPIFPWLGGKRLLARQLVDKIKTFPHTSYIEVFAGAGNVMFAKQPSKVEILNDINGDLVNLYRVVQVHLEEFLRHFKWALVAREEFARLRAAKPETLTDIQRASRFFYLQKMAFGGKLGGVYGISTTSPPKLNLLRLEEDLSHAHLRLARVNIENMDWRDLIQRYDRPHSLFYLDPPYYGCENDYGKGIFNREDFKEMSQILMGIKGKFMLSALFSWAQIEPVILKYSISKEQQTPAKELIITTKV